MRDASSFDLDGAMPIAIDRDLTGRLFPSREMADYLAGRELSVYTLIETINGAPVPLREKLDIFRSLAGQYGEPFATLSGEADAALQALITKPGEFFYVKNCWPDYEQRDVDVDGMEPYPDLDKALDGIQRFLEIEECVEDSVYWFLLEKWTLNGEGQYFRPYTYTVADEEVLFYNKENEGYLFDQSTNLNLPIPFHPGDLVRLDCAPFAFGRTNTVILEVGGNCGCCCVRAMFRQENGNWSEGALKHSHVFPNGYFPLLSPLYRLSRVQRENLAEDEKILEEVSQFVAGSDKRGRTLGMEIDHRHDSELPEDEIRNFMKQQLSNDAPVLGR